MKAEKCYIAEAVGLPDSIDPVVFLHEPNAQDVFAALMLTVSELDRFFVQNWWKDHSRGQADLHITPSFVFI